MSRTRPSWVLTGPTAAGKKEVGLEVARRCNAEVIAVDSVKVYRGMRVGGAQPSAAEIEGVTIHLVGVADPNDPWNVGRWLEAAAAAVHEIRERGRIPLFLGGTPLYLNALLRGFFDGPASQPECRRRLESESAQLGVEALHARLALVDPDSAAWIGPRDEKRIVRALEVFEIAGVPISRLQRERTRRVVDGEFRVVGLTAPDDELRARQRARVLRMLENGLVEEVRGLVKSGALLGEAARAIGYREIVAFDRGEGSLDDAVAAIVRNTWELTRKQRKWFKRLTEIEWIVRTPGASTQSLADAVIERFERST